MKEKLSPFQLIFFGVLILIIIVGVMVFSASRNSQGKRSAPITMWGIYPEEIMKQVIDNATTQENPLRVTYVEIPKENFEKALLEAIANGNAPDLVLQNQDFIYRHSNKVYKVPYESLDQKSFKQKYIQISEFLLEQDGVVGVPYVVDPLVMYWNRDILNNSGIAVMPQKWSDIVNLVPSLVVKDSATNNISKSGIALGEFKNIKNAREIFYNLMLQSGNPVLSKTVEEGKQVYRNVFSDRLGSSVSAADLSLNFFTQFSDPTKNIYSWNRSLPNSDEMFLAGDLAIYFGFASELNELRSKNPNLNFDVSQIPQTVNNQDRTNYANLYFISILKNSKNIPSAFNLMSVLSKDENLRFLSDLTYLPSVNRGLYSNASGDAVMQTFNSSALVSKTVLDPNLLLTGNTLRDMVESYTSGKSKLSEAILKASAEFGNLITN